ncbi:MAG: DUF2335 domain-containing protein [Bacteroidales bacterium]
MNQKNNNLQKNQQQAIKISAEKHEMFSGPIPHPELLQQYNLIDATFANRILSMAEDEAKNRHRNESRLTKSITITTYLGMSFAFVSVFVVSYLVYYSLSLGFEKAAGIIAVGSIASVASVFIFFKRSRQNSKNIK